jgi:hypothetical protein
MGVGDAMKGLNDFRIGLLLEKVVSQKEASLLPSTML